MIPDACPPSQSETVGAFVWVASQPLHFYLRRSRVQGEGAVPDRIRITRWAGQHEVAQSKKVKGALSWVAVPIRQGRGYCRLVNEHGAKGLGVWLGLLEIAAARSVENRGVIEGSVEDVSMMMRLRSEDVRSVLPALESIGWISLETSTNTDAPSAVVAGSERATPAVSLQTDIHTDGRTSQTDGRTSEEEEAAQAALPDGEGAAEPRNIEECARCGDRIRTGAFVPFCCAQCKSLGVKEVVA